MEVLPGVCADRFCLAIVLFRFPLRSQAPLWRVCVAPGDGDGPFPDTVPQIRHAIAQTRSLYDFDAQQINPDAVLECNMTVRRFARAYIRHHDLKRQAQKQHASVDYDPEAIPECILQM